jgi:surface antigen
MLPVKFREEFIMRLKSVVCLCLAASLLGCTTGGPNQTGGTLIGGATGALIGTQFGKGHGRLAGVALGTMLGSFIGSSIGKQMDEEDRRMAASSTYSALESQPDNRPIAWRNPNNQHSGTVIVTRTQESSNKVCRDYVQTVTIDGKQQQVGGRACRDVRDPQGQWLVQQ